MICEAKEFAQAIVAKVNGRNLPRCVGSPRDSAAFFEARMPRSELRRIFGDGVNQAADLVSGATSIPSRNLTPLMTLGN